MEQERLNNKLKLLIFIVAYNAESHIEKVLDNIPYDLSNEFDLEILLIDDASQDNTSLVSNLYNLKNKKNIKILRNPLNQGYGGNQKIGYQYAIVNGFDIVALLHGDGQYNPKCLPMLVKPVADDQADAVFGSRMINKKDAIKGGMPLYKFIGNIILTQVQNRMLHTGLSEFHSGYRIYSVKALKKIPFDYNSNYFDFDTDIIIQLLDNGLRIKELPIPTYYGDEISYVNGIKYAFQIVWTTILSRIQRAGLYYHPKFDYEQGFVHYPSKVSFSSSHSFAIESVKEASLVIDFGCASGNVSKSLTEKHCRVVMIDKYIPEENRKYAAEVIEADLDGIDLTTLANYQKADYILLLDVIEHLKSPELFLKKLRDNFDGNAAKIIITTPNIGFFIERFGLLFGRFTYKKRGILDLTHVRLFTFSSIRKLLTNFGYEIKEIKGLPAPFPLVFRSPIISSFLLRLNNILIKISKGLFSYQIAIIAEPKPTLRTLLKNTIRIDGQDNGSR